MSRLSSSSFAERAAAAALMAVLAAAPAPAQTAGQSAAPAAVVPLLEQAAAAEAELRIEAAIDRLYLLLIEHPGTGDALTARLRLARLLALAGDVPQAVLQCQLLRNELPADHPLRRDALELATALARRLRAGQAGQAYFPTFEAVVSRGVQALDEPRAIIFEHENRLLLLDEGGGKLYRVAADGSTLLSVPQEPAAVAVLPDGSVLVAGKTGLAPVPPSRVIALSGTWGGKVRQVKKIRSMAALADGNLLVIDRDYDGVLRCLPANGACQPWGPAGKYRVVRVGPTGWVFLLDDRGQGLRVLDAAQKSITLIGPTVGAAKLQRVEDIAVDGAHGVYLLDKDLRQVFVLHMKTQADGRIAAVPSATAMIPQEGDRALKNPTAIGVSPSGQVYLGGKSSARVMRFR
jgi:hypothetical protein